MKLFNTLTQQKEDFKPLNKQGVGLYSCGPTVYNVATIGNLRAYIFVDILKRILNFNYFKVNHVMNITDIDDKTIKASKGEKTEFQKLIRKYEDKFFADLSLLNIVKPDQITRATKYIDKMVSFIEDLIRTGYAYKASDGSTYFSIDKFREYGKLSHLDKEGIKVGARVAQDEYDKENPSDFALWKAWDEDDGEIYWETSLGKGRPGWHIECSAMSMDKLGETIDIHTGGVDNIFPHHENEIAQSEARTGKDFVNYWVHCEHLMVDSKKMSKSLGNVFYLDDIIDKGFSPLDFRYLLLGAHYRTKVNFTWNGLESAKNTRERLVRILKETKTGSANNEYLNHFKERVSDDLDTPGGLAILWDMIRDESLSKEDKYSTALEMDKVLGLKLNENETEDVPEEISNLVSSRDEARDKKDFVRSDSIRQELTAKGWIVEDTASGTKVTRK